MRFVFFAGTTYDHRLSGRTRRLASALASMGHAVAFVEMPSLRATVRRLWPREPAEGRSDKIQVVHLAPLPGLLRLQDAFLVQKWAALLRKQLLRQIPMLRESTLIVSTPVWVPVIRGLPRRLLCYDYIDHLSVHSGPRHWEIMASWDEELLAACDVVSTVSASLRRALSVAIGSKPIGTIPNGVEQGWLEFPPAAIPRDMLVNDPRQPIAGFVGALFEWVDLSLLVQLAGAMPAVTFVLAGPTRFRVSVRCLKQVQNIRLFPSQPFAAVPRWIGAFDVCLIPFKRTVASRSADPIKLYEYVALGKPVVGTMRYGPEEDRAPMLVATEPDEFARCVRRSLDDSPDRRQQRLAFASRHTWQRRARDLVSLVESA